MYIVIIFQCKLLKNMELKRTNERWTAGDNRVSIRSILSIDFDSALSPDSRYTAAFPKNLGALLDLLEETPDVLLLLLGR
jgi:hypothetical protein